MAAQRIYHILLASTALGAINLAPTTPVFAGPEDGTITAGSATISQSGLTTSIHQSSDRAIIDWRSFDVNADESVRFFQPGSSSITLNRINDSKASLINGQIEANGHILLLNQNGIVFGATSRVDVAGLIATTGRIDDAAFMSGATTLAVTQGNNPNARIINNGLISARDAGLVGLVGPHVENNGIINAHLGKVTLAGAERYTLDLAGDNLISIDVSDTINGKVINTGSITADGGTITLTAARAREAVEQSIINTGTLQANHVGTRNGRIILSAGGNRAGDTNRGQSSIAAVKQAGKIEASKGSVEILGDSVHITETSEIDTSAADGGGTINIGGSYQGTDDRETSTWVEVDRGSRTRSSGDINGDGGSIIFWANRLMTFRGYAEAKGGSISGDGGLVEVSGKNQLIFDGHVNTTATNGKTGMLLLDPTNIEITTNPDQNVTGTSPFTPDADDVVSYLNATTLLNALASTSVIVQTRATGSQLGDITVNAALTWGSGNTLTLDAHHDIVINQAINGANLTLSAGNDVQINAALTGTGLLHILPQSAGGTIGVGTGAAGALQLSNADLGNITDGWSTIRIGRGDGAGAMTMNARTWGDNLEILSGSGAITVNGAQSMGANNLTIRTDADLVLNAALSGTGNLTIEQSTASTTIGLGTGQAGTLNLTTAEVGNITNGWNSLTFGRSDGSGAINIGALTWNDHLTVQSGSGIISINGIQTMGANNLTYMTDANLAVGAALNGTGILNIRGNSNNTTIGVGTGQAGSLQLTNAEAGNLDNTWSSIIIGYTAGTGDINVGALTWVDPITYQSSTGAININGAQTMGINNLTFISDANPLIGAALGGTGTLSFQTATNSTTIGLGGAAGTFNLSTAELLNITDGWALISVGQTTGTGALSIDTTTWNDALLLQSGSGIITVAGTQTIGANTLTLRTDSDLAINAGLTGTGTLNIQGTNAATTIGIAGGAGSLDLGTSDIANITDGWGNIVIGTSAGTGAITVNAATWSDHLTLQSGTGILTIAGIQNMGANNLTLSTDSDIALNANLTGTGILTLQGATAATSMGLAGQAGTFNIDATELGRISDGWGNIIIGRTDGTGAIAIGARTWTDNLTVQSNTGIITIAGTQTMGANNLTLSTDSDTALNANLTGSGTLTLQGNTASTTIGLAGQAGSLNLDTTELSRLTDGWSNIIVGRSDGTGAIAVGAEGWTDPLTFLSSTGVITIAGAQTMAGNALTFRTDADIVLNAALTGSGTLNIQGNNAATTIGLAGQAGTINLTSTEIGRLTDGWGNIVIGRTDGTGAVSVGTQAWTDALTYQSGSGVITVAGVQTMGANALTIRTDADIALNAALTGTGTLTVTQSSVGTTMGLGNAAAGTINLTATEIGRITNGWASLVFGRVDGTGAINVTANTWNDHLTLRSLTGVIGITGTQTMTTNNLTISTDADLNVGGTLLSTGTGTLTIAGQSAATTMGIGTGQAGTIQFSNAEVTNLTNGWANVILGRVDGTGDMNIGAATWLDPMTFRTLTGGINITGTQTMAANSLTITTDGDLNVGGTLLSTGTGTLSIFGQSVGTTIGLGTGQAGTIQLSDTEVTNLSNGWASILIGRTNGSGDINVGAATWLDPLTLRTSTGQIFINGTQTMAANNLTVTTDANLEVLGALNGTGNLSISGQTATTSFGLGDGQAGTIHLSDAEIANLQNTWTNIFIGATNTTGAMNVGALTWVDPLTLRTGSGLMTISGTQTMGGNNLTISTDSAIVLSPGANLTGTGNLVITTSATGTTIGLGNAQTGTMNLNTTELGQITDGWNSITIGNAGGTAIMNVGTLTFNDALTLRNSTAAINLNGTLTMAAGNSLTLTNGTGAVNITGGLTTNGGGNVAITTAAGVIGVTSAVTLNGGGNLTFTTNGNMNIGAGGALTGTGNLIIQTAAAATTIGLGNGAAGALQLTDVELGRITDGWASHTYGQAGGTGTITVGANTWHDNVTLLSDSGAINITGAIDVGANNLTISTNSNPTFSGTLAGTGILTIRGQGTGTIMNIAGTNANLSIDNADLGNILNGWAGIIFGRNDATGAMNIGAYTWQYDTTFRTGTGLMTVAGAQTSTGNALTYETDSNMSIGANISGTGTLTIRGSANGTSMGLAGAGGGLQLSAAELNFIQDGWGQLVFGRSTATAAFAANARTWTDNVQFISGSGLMTVAGQTMNTGTNLTLTTDSNLAITGNLAGSGGKLTIEATSPGTGIGVGTGQTGTLVLDAAEIGRFTGTWTNGIQIGNNASTAAINIGTNSWSQPMTFLTQGNIILNGVQTSTRNAGNSLVFASLGGNFVNNTGSATPINPGTGTARYLIYSFSAGTDTYGTMTPPGATGMQTYYSYGPGAVVEAGNRIIYSSGAPKVIYIQIDNKTKVYGDTIPVLSWTYIGGLQGGDTLGNAITNSTLSASGALVTDNAGTTSAITGMFATGLGYTVSITDGTLTVIKAPVTVQAAAVSREYGDANPASFAVNYIGLRNGDTAADIDTAATATTTATVLSNAGNYNITSSGAIDNNYVFNYANGTLTITKATLTITAEDKTREYGDANPALTVTYSGFKNGDTSAVIDTNPTLATTADATTGVGNIAITLTGGTDNNYNLILVNGTLTITKAMLTVTADNQTREYGDTNPALTVSYTGFKNGETVTDIDTAATASTLANATSGVGSYAITAAGATDSNYDFTYVDGNLAITRAMITVTADNQTREYGDANPALTVSYSGFKNGENSAVFTTGATAATTAIATTNVGTVAITASGAADDNYDFTYVNGTLAITKAMLTVTASSNTREYGDANPALTVSYTGFKNGETSAVIDTGATASTLAILTSNVGNYATTASGASDNNYDFTYIAGNLAITKATLTATADNQTREYGDTNPTLTTSYTGFKNGETFADIDTLATAATTATATTNVGTYAITTSGASDINYNFNYVDGVLTIDRATLTITADNRTREYGDTNPALTVSYSGFKNGETSAVLDTIATASTTANAFSNVGSVAITASGASDGNYSFIYVDGSMSITRAMLTVTADNKTKVYGDDNPALTVSYSGFKNGETSAVLDTAATASTLADALSNVGSYSITASGAADTNYDFTYVAGSLAITKADLTITADNQTREYGDANPALTVSYSGFRNGDTSAVLDTAPTLATSATALTGVGSHAITLTGGTDNNYNLILQNGSLTITKATLTATANNATREYGDANPALTVSYSGFKNGETAAVIDTGATAITTAIATTGVGSYAITASGAADTNYDFVYVDGTLAITTATVTVTANNATREYGDANPALGVSYSGFKNGETSAVLDTTATATTAAIATTGVGSYAITASGAADTNYDFVYVDGTLAITSATITVTANNATREYGDANPALGVSYSGFKNGETAAVIDTGATASTAATATTGAGTYAITVSGANDDNYDFVYADGSLTITKATLTVTANNATREYGDANPALTVSYAGFKNGETAAVIDTAATASTLANATSNVGIYTITASGANDANYDFVYADGSLTITKATLTATANNATREYGDANPALAVSYTGFKNGETAAVIDAAATAATLANATSAVGSYIISASGASDLNYDFVYADGSLSITKAVLTVTANNTTREYGDANPAFGVSYSGFKNGETSAILDTAATATSTATATTNAGSYAITAAGAADTNYDFVYVDGSLTITKASVTVTANNQTREYGLANPALTASYSGFKNSETEAVLDTGVTLTTGATIGSNVGNYAIIASGASDVNYDFIYVDGTMSITKAMLTITADDKNREYGDANPALTVSYSGFRNGDTSSVLDSLATIATTATATTDAGTAAITVSGGTDNNYDYSYVDGTLTIDKADLVITADDQIREYGDANQALSVSYSGFKNGETAMVIDSGPSIGTAANAFSNVADYLITLTGGTDNNYNLILQDGTLSVTKATLTATADNQTREYGDANPGFTVTYTGFKNGETAAVIDTGVAAGSTANAFTSVGSHAIVASGGLDNNYNFAYVDGTLAITQASVTITVNNTSREYGLANPAFTASYSGFKNGETASVIDTGPVFNTGALIGSDVGSYIVTASGAADTNYSFNFVNGNMTITQAALTVRADDQIRLYGDPNPPLTYTLTGLRNGDTASVLSGLAISTGATPLSPEGDYAIAVGGASAINYSLSYIGGTLSVVAAMPLPVPPSPAVTPVSALPGTADNTISNPGYVGAGYNPLYNTAPGYIFMNNTGRPGRETEEGSIRTDDGYITVFYYQNPFEETFGEPLLFIDPNLYLNDDEEEEYLAKLGLD